MGDYTGSLVALEENKNIPFEIKRVYYIFDTKEGVIRGKHAHTNLEQVLICTSGSCKILLDDGFTRQEILLDDCSKGLYIGNNIWREMHEFTQNCVLMVLASQYYDENDYVRNYQEFLNCVK